MNDHLCPHRRLAALALAAGLAGACTLPLTTQTLTGGALNAGAMLFVDRYNDEDSEGRGAYRYEARASVDTLTAIFEAAIETANRSYLFRSAETYGPRPMARETLPERQWTPSPRYEVRAGSPEVRGDTLSWVVTHRSSRQAAFLLVSRAGGAHASVAIVPYDPPNDVFLSVPTDHAQRNAVETLHETFYFAVTERLGPEILTRPFAGETP